MNLFIKIKKHEKKTELQLRKIIKEEYDKLKVGETVRGSIKTLIKKGIIDKNHWLAKAKTKDEIIKIENSVHGTYITWEDGIWINGTWFNGIWKDGFWIGGRWAKGTWKNGNWIKGKWSKGKDQFGSWQDEAPFSGNWDEWK